MFATAMDRALAVAALVHREQTRKGTKIPYIVHPAHVAMLLMQYGYGEPLTVAAVLHDVLEDIDLDDRRLLHDLESSFPGHWEAGRAADEREVQLPATIREMFGADVLRLVEAVSEPRTDRSAGRPWIERRRDMVTRLGDAQPDEMVLKAADALHNVSSMIEDLSLGRASLEGRFKATPAETIWYYRQVSRLVTERAGDVRLANDLANAVGALEALIRVQE